MDSSLLLWTLTISLMFTGGRCFSQSMSCSTVNGKTVCERQQSEGNVAGASSSSFSGPGRTYQDANAMSGNSYTGQSVSSGTAVGNMPPGFGYMPAGYNAGGFPFTFGGSSASDSSNSNTGSASFTSTSGSDFQGFNGGFAGSGAYAGSPGFAIAGFPGFTTGGFSGADAGGFFGGSGVFVGGGNPNMFGPGFPFSFVFGRKR